VQAVKQGAPRGVEPQPNRHGRRALRPPERDGTRLPAGEHQQQRQAGDHAVNAAVKLAGDPAFEAFLHRRPKQQAVGYGELDRERRVDQQRRQAQQAVSRAAGGRSEPAA